MTDDSFVFYGTFREQLKELPDDMRLKFYDYICDYGLAGTVPEVRGIEKALWIPIQFAIDRAKEKRAQNQRNGAKGGRPTDANGNPAQPELPGIPEEPAESETAQPETTSTICPATENDNNPTEPEHNRIEPTVTGVKPNVTQPNPIKPEETDSKPEITQQNPSKPTESEINRTITDGNPIKPTVTDYKPDKSEANPAITEQKRPKPTANLNVNGNANGNGSSSVHAHEKIKESTTTSPLHLHVREYLRGLGFDFDENAQERIVSSLICKGYTKQLNYLDYCLDTLTVKKFPDGPFLNKPKAEQQTLFLTAVTQWSDWQRGFESWKAAQEKAAKQKAAAHERDHPPAVCPDCGATLENRNGQPVCTHCCQTWEFEGGTWLKHKMPADFSGIWETMGVKKPADPQFEIF